MQVHPPPQAFILQKQALKAPITLVHFITSTVLIVATGPYLFLISSKTGIVLSEKVDVFSTSERTHGIAIHPFYLGESINALVYGAKSIAWIKISLLNSSIAVQHHHQVHDWIKSVAFISPDDLNTIKSLGYVAITAHNCVHVYSELSCTKPTAIYQCQDRCFLNSAAIYGNSINTMVIASGTVFNQILLWNLNADQDGTCAVEKKLFGHEGVIFHAHFYSSGTRLSTVSDDRSIRIWDTRSGEMTHVLFGHTARVWMSQHISNDLICSISEDSTCRVWQLEPPSHKDKLGKYECLVEWTGHLGKNVWCLCVDPDKRFIATGGNDGGLRLWDTARLASQKIESEDLLTCVPLLSKTSRAMLLEMIGNKSVITLYRNGHLSIFNVLTHQIMDITPPSGPIMGYNCMACTANGSHLLFGNIKGEYLFVSPSNAWDSWTVDLVHKAEIISVFTRPILDTESVWTISYDHTNMIVVGVLDCLNNRWDFQQCLNGLNNLSTIMDVQFITLSVLIASFRDGSLALYSFTTNNNQSTSQPVNPILVFPIGQGKHAITSILSKASAPFTWELITTSRDGFLGYWDLRLDEIKLCSETKCSELPRNDDRSSFYERETQLIADSQEQIFGLEVPLHVRNQIQAKITHKYAHETSKVSGVDAQGTTWTLTRHHKERVTHGWLEQGVRIGNQLFAVGFHNKHLFVHNHTTGTQPLTVACGGAHRKWHIGISESELGTRIQFVFIRKDRVFIFDTETNGNGSAQQCAPYVPKLLDALHGKEIRAAVLLPGVKGCDRIVVTGSEDTSMALINLQQDKVVGRVNKHISVVKAISLAGPNYLFSAGGCEELFAWRLDYNAGQDACPTIYNIAKYEPTSACSECRIMALDSVLLSDHVALIMAGFSDGRVHIIFFEDRVWSRFDIAGIACVDRCVLDVKICQLGNECYAVAAATNGYVYAWPIQALINTDMLSYKTQAAQSAHNPLLVPTINLNQPSIIKVHQSGVNTIDIITCNDSAWVVTGGDDNAIHVLRLSQDGSWSHLFTNSSAHYSSITGIKWLDRSSFVSASIDQRVTIWAIDKGCCLNTIDPILFTKSASLVADIADISVLACHDNEVIVTGAGIQKFQLITTHAATQGLV